MGLLLRLVLRRRRDARSGGEREESRLVRPSCGNRLCSSLHSFIHSFEAALTNASVVDAVLDKLATTPERSHDGASTLLLTWPFERADGEGALCYVAGERVRLCEGLDFVRVDKCNTELSLRSAEGVYTCVAMVREPRRCLLSKESTIGGSGTDGFFEKYDG